MARKTRPETPDAGGTVPAYARIPLGMDTDRRVEVGRTNRRLALVMSLIAAALMAAATMAYINTVRAAESEALRRLETFNMLRHDAVLAFFRTHDNEARIWAENREFEARAEEIFEDWRAMTRDEKADIRAHLVEGAPLPAPTPAQTTYLDHTRRITPTLLSFIEHHGFYDLFLFDPEGELAYTVVREDDFGLAYGETGSAAANPYYDTGLGRVARQAATFDIREGGELPTAVSDFEPYAPSGGSMEAFIAEPLPSPDGRGKAGVLAIQLSFAELNHILDYRSGLSASGRTLLVGADGSIRNTPETLPEGAALRLDTEPVTRALAGERFRGAARGASGQPTYAASQPLDYNGLRWAVLTEVDRDEVRAPLRIYLWTWLLSLLGIAITSALMYQILRVRR